MNVVRLFACLLVLCAQACAQGKSAAPEDVRTSPAPALQALLASAKRIPARGGWFEIVKLPNDVYAFWEPGHVEEVNAFLILGDTFDVLYDTGMGIGSLAAALADVRRVEQLPDKPLMVINSHNHLDHNGGNKEFPEVWTVNEPWALQRLTQGVPAGKEGGFVNYWAELQNHPGVTTPSSFAADRHFIPPYPLEQVRFLEDSEVIDLGNRQFKVIRTFAHSPDGVALYDESNGLFFGGDAFYGPNYLVTDLQLLAVDLARTAPFDVSWHYASHGVQLIEVMQHGRHLAVVRRMIAGEQNKQTTTFAGVELPVIELDGVTVMVAPDLLLY